MTDARTRILEQIRQSLAVNRDLLLGQAAAYPPPHPRDPVVPSDLDLIEQFNKELSTLHAYVHLCEGQNVALAKLRELLEATNARQVLAWALDELPLAGVADVLDKMGIDLVDRRVLGAADRQKQLMALDPVLVGISGVDAAIAESGSMVVASGSDRGRLASLLPPVHIALLPADRIVRTLPEAFDRLHEQYGDRIFTDRSNITVITGPSRTADIELSLTLGVHGPREVHALVFD